MITKVPAHPANYEKGRKYPINGVVLHIAQGSLIGTDSWFANPSSQVSSHEGIGKNGDVHIYVEREDTAYHAGRVNQPTWPLIKKTTFGGIVNPNGYTYGIENEGFRGDTWTEPQMASLVDRVRLALQIAGLSFTRAHVISHSEIAADKEDMKSWCDEVIRRLNSDASATPPPQNKDAIKRQIISLVELL